MEKAQHPQKGGLFSDRIADFLITSDLGPEEISKRILTGLVIIITIPFAFLFSGVLLLRAEYTLGFFLLFVGIEVTVSVIIGRNLKDNRNLYRINLAFIGLLFLYLIGTSGPHPPRILWAFLFPLEAFYLLGLNEGRLYNTIFYMIALVLIFSQDLIYAEIYYDTTFKIQFLVTLLVIILMSYSFERVRYAYRQGMKNSQLRIEEERAELEKVRDQLLHAGEELERQVERRTEELLTANQQLRQEIEERVRSEDALKESEEKYRLHFENVSDVIYTINRDLEVETVSPSGLSITGFKAEELVGRSIAEVQSLAPEYQDKALSDIKRVFAGESISATEYVFIGKDGRKIFAEVSGSPLIKEGETVGMIAVARDITDRKEAAEEKARFEKHLIQAQKMEAVGTLAGGIAHDFNNLLMGIQGRTSLMTTEIGSSHPHFEHLKGIEDYVKSAADLTKQLLGFSSGGKYEVKPTDANEIIKVSYQMFGRTKKEIRIHTKLQPGLWTIDADEKQIEQVLLNLYINAWQAMPEGGNLYLQTENVRLDEDYPNARQVKPGKYVKISVTDTGVGMDDVTRQKIFDPFFTTKEMGRGTGMGLASAYGIVKNHDGIIDVYSEKGQGTTFVIHLPASEKEVTRKKEAQEELLKGSGTILLVDDEAMILDVGQPMLEKLGYTVMVARDGQEALDLYRKKSDQIDLVILDMIMPDMGGGETYDQLKEINPHIKVILSSGYSVGGQAQSILSRGCDGFIQKPFTLKALSQKTREVLDKVNR